MSTSYIQNLNDFSRKFILRGGYTPNRADAMLYRVRLENIKSSIFESFLLFDKTCFKVVGENIPLAVLINEVGVAGLEKLIDQEALSFLHWKNMVGNMVDNIPGVLPLISGTYNEGPYVDPEESIATGLKILANQPNKRQRQTIIRKVRDLYQSSNASDPSETTMFVTSAFDSGKLRAYGLDNEKLDIYKLSKEKKQDLVKCAEDLLEYKQVISDGLTTLENSRFISLFNNTAEKISKINHNKVVRVVSELEGFPDLKTVYENIGRPLQKSVGLREKRNVIKFRKWLDAAPTGDQAEITRAYLDAIAAPTGFFETEKGKLTKMMAMTIVGAGVGVVAAPISTSVGAAVGVIAGKLVEPALSFGLDLVDEYLISGITHGWTPRMFFSEINKSGLRIEPTL